MSIEKRYSIFFLINHGMHLLDIAGPCQALHEANKQAPLFKIYFVGFSRTVHSHQGLDLTNILEPPIELPERSIIFVCASKYEPNIYSDPESARSIEWLRQAIREDTLVVGICTGAFMLAKAGLVDGKEVTTHHSLTTELAQQFPDIQVLTDRIFVRSDNIYTSAGVTAGIDTTLYLISQLASTRTSVDVARELVVHRRRMANDKQISDHLKYRNHISPLVHAVQDYICEHFRESLNIADVCHLHRVSQRHMQRIFKEHTDITVRDYIASLRLEEARQLLENGMGVEQAAHLAGFPNPSSFRDAWKKRYGGLPGHKKATDKADAFIA
ncbi:GlxA family transcriptional regulator [Gynuella sp.]|uniref:GlxA family transcriptional regulator n=1 Tax=Gynuella sp. TaxID=2969146 RepID=UPI003D110E20